MRHLSVRIVITNRLPVETFCTTTKERSLFIINMFLTYYFHCAFNSSALKVVKQKDSLAFSSVFIITLLPAINSPRLSIYQ